MRNFLFYPFNKFERQSFRSLSEDKDVFEKFPIVSALIPLLLFV